MQYALCCGQAVPPPKLRIGRQQKTGNKRGDCANRQPPALNPFIRHIYTADPSAHVWADGRLYVYASHDIDPPRGCDLMDQYHVFSTDDMVHWTDHGDSPRLASALGRKEGGFMWAPDCAYRTARIISIFPHPSGTYTNDSWKIGVATSKEPAANFTVQGYIEGLIRLSDPCVCLWTTTAGLPVSGRLKDNMMEIAARTRSGRGSTWAFLHMGGSDSFHQPWFHRGIQGRNGLLSTIFDSLVQGNSLRSVFARDHRFPGHNPDGTIRMVAAQVRRTLVKSGGVFEK